MHDDHELRSILRRIDRPTDPDPAFADALFARLTATPAVRPGRGPMLLLAAALLVGLLAAGAAVGSGLVEVPWFSAEATPPVLPSASVEPTDAATPSATPAGTASAEPSASAEPIASAAPQIAELQLGSFVAPVLDGVTLRESPGTGGTRVGTLAQDSLNYVVDGPVVADGYAWYALSGPGLPPSSGCITPVPTDPLECPTWFGWAAAGDPDGTAWFEPTDGDCPDPEADSARFLRMQHVLQLGCYGTSQVTFTAYFPEVSDNAGRGGECAVDPAIVWLYCTNLAYDLVEASPEEGGVEETLFVDPDSAVTLPERGQWLRITGAFDHPASALCADASEAFGDRLGPEQAVLECRTHFVVSAAEVTSAP
jgi:hypothetical protein